LEIIAAIRARYDGARRNPFDEAECGHHYARAMASWSSYATWNQTSYSGLDRRLTIGRPDKVSFWSTGSAFGRWDPSGSNQGTLTVLSGELQLDQLVVGDQVRTPATSVLAAGARWSPAE
jgi:hypothetical protein